MVGLLPVVLAPLPAEEVAHCLAQLHGLILSGGEDVDPALYGASRHPKVTRVNPERDEWEIQLVRAAQALELPLLAICRGVQLLNVALGGTLIQDIPTQLPNALAHDERRSQAVHSVAIEPESRLASIVGCREISVNSVHHQSVDRPAPGLVVTGRAPDGVVEALEWAGDWWALGLQWHPETMQQERRQWHRRLFAAFADAAVHYRNRGTARGSATDG
jgi:putative glutamine amidotransferase